MTKGCIFTLWTSWTSLLTSKTSFTVFRSIPNALKTVIYDTLKQTIPIHVQKNCFSRSKNVTNQSDLTIKSSFPMTWVFPLSKNTKFSTNRGLFNKKNNDKSTPNEWGSELRHFCGNEWKGLVPYFCPGSRRRPQSLPRSKMALACIRTAKTNFLALPFLVSTARVELTRKVSKMARSCKAGRNKRREVKVGLNFSIQIRTSHVFWPKFVFPFYGMYFSLRNLALNDFQNFFLRSTVVSPLPNPKSWGLQGDTRSQILINWLGRNDRWHHIARQMTSFVPKMLVDSDWRI